MVINFNHSCFKGDLKKSNNKICKSANHFLSGIAIIFSFITFSVQLLSFHDRGVESIPGPNYTTEKVVQGLYHQDDERLGDAARVQRARNSLFALV